MRDEIQKYLLGWQNVVPDVVIDTWLLPIAQEYGWPPNEKWHYVLSRKKFDEWQQIRWSYEEIEIDFSSFYSGSISTIHGLIDTYVHNQKNDYSNLINGKDRFNNCVIYIMQNGGFPKPPLLMKGAEGFEVIDGNHRMAAYWLVDQLERQGYLKERAVKLKKTHDVVVAYPPDDWQTRSAPKQFFHTIRLPN